MEKNRLDLLCSGITLTKEEKLHLKKFISKVTKTPATINIPTEYLIF